MRIYKLVHTTDDGDHYEPQYFEKEYYFDSEDRMEGFYVTEAPESEDFDYGSWVAYSIELNVQNIEKLWSTPYNKCPCREDFVDEYSPDTVEDHYTSSELAKYNEDMDHEHNQPDPLDYAEDSKFYYDMALWNLEWADRDPEYAFKTIEFKHRADNALMYEKLFNQKTLNHWLEHNMSNKTVFDQLEADEAEDLNKDLDSLLES